MIKKVNIIAAALSLAILTPSIALADVLDCKQGTLCSLINTVIDYLDKILFLLMALAVVMFAWNVIKYFIKADADRKAAGQYVMYSLIGFFVILSLWGIINIFGNSFGIGNANNQESSLENIDNLLPSR